MGVLTYFVYHFIEGKRGWLSWKALEKDLEAAQEKLKTLKETESHLRNKVDLLRPESLDEDMLDERVRAMLGTAKGDEIIIIDEDE